MAVVGYNVYRKTKEDGRYIKIAGVSGPPYEDRLVTSGRTYFYVVTALDKKGLESRFSESVQATIP
jgi:fibronectin type 3 domain-containing protein